MGAGQKTAVIIKAIFTDQIVLATTNEQSRLAAEHLPITFIPNLLPLRQLFWIDGFTNAMS
jgi:hypothetical protein